MRPLLVSLALLLLALCRLADSANDVIKADKIFKNLPDEKRTELYEKMGEFFTLSAMYKFWMQEEDPSFQKHPKSVDNGVQCLLADTTLGETLTKQLYPTGDRLPEETEVAKALFGIDCAVAAAGTPEWDCFCTKKSTIFYCAAYVYKKKHITAPMGKCKKEALDELKLAGKKSIGKFYEYAEFIKKMNDNAAIKAVYTEDSTAIDNMSAIAPEAVKVLCDAIDPDVEKKVKALFASDILFNVMEAGIFVKAVGEEQLEITKNACENDAEFKSSEFGKCLCTEDSGVIFCALKVYGNAFKEAGYLDCAADKLVDAKKPAALPQMKPKSAPPAPTTAPSGGGNGTATTTAAARAGAATSSSLLLAPLAAAAAALLRQ